MFSSIKKLFTGNQTTKKDVVNQATLNQENQPVQAKPVEEKNAGFQIEHDAILTNQKAENRREVLALIARIMKEKGYVSADYTDALEAREQAVSTYLINGVAIPHGVNEAKSLVAKTGIVIVQLPEGVQWNDNGDIVHLAVGIAAKGSEHIEVLQHLSTVVMDEARTTHLGTKATVKDIASAISLTGNTSSPDVVIETETRSFDAEAQCIIVDESGLHARPASLLVNMAKQFPAAEIWITKGTQQVKIQSMTKLLALGAVYGDTLTISVSGEGASEAVDHIVAAIKKGLDSESEQTGANSDYQPAENIVELKAPKGRQLLKGIPASPGIALANAFIMADSQEFNINQKGGSATEEQTSLEKALKEAQVQLQELHNSVAKSSPNEAAIFAAQAELLGDTELLDEAQKLIQEGSSAAWSWHKTIDAQVTTLEANDAERIRARAADMRDIGERVLNILQGTVSEINWPEEPFVLIAKELTPSQTAQLGKQPVKAICTELGGATSHMAILSRALGIPALVGVGAELLQSVQNNELVAVAPQTGDLILSPDSETVEKVEACISQWQAIQEKEFAGKDKPAITQDGVEIEVVCNIASADDAEKVVPHGGAGVGLLRTEFLFETASEEPTVEAQVQALTEIVKPLGSRILIVRTSDIGGDKPVSWLSQPKEENPFLGIRGIRLSLRHPDVFKRQLEAIYQVAKNQVAEEGATGIHIMFPMISSLDEWHQAKNLAEEVRQSIGAPEVPLGMMIEVPSAVLLAEHFAKEVAFFSIGTNDLTQYTLAMDRMNPELSDPLDNYNPALLQMIAMTTKAANAAGKWVGVCGNLVAEPDLAKLLIGMGVKELSMSPVSVPAVKELVRSTNYDSLQRMAEEALEAATPSEVKDIICKFKH